MAEGLSGHLDSVTQCPLCQAPVNSSDGLQVHYLTSCSGYDMSHEEPRSKIQDSSRVGSVADDPPRGGDSDVGVRGKYGGESGIEHSAATPTRYDCSVQFMWQPLTQISYPSVTLLASFQRGSVELTMDPEGGHYASEFVNIPKGSYEGQLVVGDSFIHPIKEFKVHKDDDIIVLQFIIERDYSGYDMKTNPSYMSSATTSSGSVRYQPSLSYSNPMYGYKTEHHTTTAKPYQSSSEEGGIYSTSSSTSGSSHTNTSREYLQNEEAIRGGNHSSTHPRTAAADNLSVAGGRTGHSAGTTHKQHETRTDQEPENYLPHDYTHHPKPKSSDTKVPASWSTVYSESGSHHDEDRGERELKQQLEEVTRERDTLKSNQERVNATWESRVKRLEMQLQRANMGSEAHEVSSHLTSTVDMRKEIDELKDHNTALEEQIHEYQQSMEEKDKLIQTVSAGKETKQLLDFTKKQQLEHVESFSVIKERIEKAMKLHDEYIKVSQTNIDLADSLEDYRNQTKQLQQELRQRDGEIMRLKEERSNNRIALELETWKEKCQGWKEEVERLMPLEQAVEKLGRENEELSHEITLLVDEGEQHRSSERGGTKGGNVMDYDAMMERMVKLQDTRVHMEEELSVLREERKSLLHENASLREGNQPQLYANLKANYETVSEEFRNTKLKLLEEKKLTEELRGATLEFQQKLIQATDPDRLKSIQERMDRYKKERDTARAEVEDREAKLALAEVERQSLQDALASISNKENEMLRRLDSTERELSRTKMESQKFETRMRGYREERNVAKEDMKALKQQIRNYQEHYSPNPSESTTPSLADPSGLDEITAPHESSHSPSHEHHQYGSPVLEYAPDRYGSSGSPFQLQHYNRESPSVEDHYTHVYHHTGRSSEASSIQPKDSCHYSVVEVKTKDGVISMAIQRPVNLPNPKTKPQIIVKRADKYETGTLMYVGKINSKDIVGVILDNRMEKSTSSSGPAAYDGTNKDGKRYFKCANGYGFYVPLSRIYIEVETATV